MARTHREQASTPVHLFSFPFTHLPLSLSLTKADLSLPHLRSVLLCSALRGSGTLVQAKTSSAGGEGPSIPPSICYSIPGSIFSEENEMVSQTEQTITFIRNPTMISKRLSNKKKKNLTACSCRFRVEKIIHALLLLLMSLCKCHIKKDNGRSGAKQLGYCLQRCRILNRVLFSGAVGNKSRDSNTKGDAMSEGFVSPARHFSARITTFMLG